MASVDTTAAQRANGHGTGREIPVDNPATGEVIAHVADLSAERVAELAARGRAAQPGWQALGFDGRVARHAAGCRSGSWTTPTTSSRRSSRRPARPTRTPTSRRSTTTAARSDFWAKQRRVATSPTSTIHASTLAVKGKKMVVRYEPLGLIGVIGPWNYPLTNSFGDCIPALLAGNSVILKPSEVTPLTSLLLAEGLASAACPRASSRSPPAAGRPAPRSSTRST